MAVRSLLRDLLEPIWAAYIVRRSGLPRRAAGATGGADLARPECTGAIHLPRWAGRGCFPVSLPFLRSPGFPDARRVVLALLRCHFGLLAFAAPTETQTSHSLPECSGTFRLADRWVSPPVPITENPIRRSSRAVLSVLLTCSVLTACGGGGGGSGDGVSATGGGDPTTPPRPPRPAVDLSGIAATYAGHSDYRAAWGLAQIGAATAYARIAARDGRGAAPGQGARIAVIDNGVDEDHWEFNGLTISQTCPPTDGCGDRTHGTPVASVIAARGDNTLTFSPPTLSQYNFHGVAWGLDRLDVLSIRLGRGGGSYAGIDDANVDDVVNGVANVLSALQRRVDFVNMSFSRPGLIENYRGKTFGPLYAPAVATLAQTGRATGKTILVMAAGNAHGVSCASTEPNCVGGRIDATSPELYSGLPVLEASLRGNMVAVVATDRNGNIASFSNRCGIAAKWCIAAPGDSMWLASYCCFSG